MRTWNGTGFVFQDQQFANNYKWRLEWNASRSTYYMTNDRLYVSKATALRALREVAERNKINIMRVEYRRPIHAVL